MLVVLVEVIMLPSCCSFVPLLIKKKKPLCFLQPVCAYHSTHGFVCGHRLLRSSLYNIAKCVL